MGSSTGKPEAPGAEAAAGTGGSVAGAGGGRGSGRRSARRAITGPRCRELPVGGVFLPQPHINVSAETGKSHEQVLTLSVFK